MDKWPEKTNGEIPCLPKKSLFCRNWNKNFSSNSSQDAWNDGQNFDVLVKRNSVNVSRNSEFSNQDINQSMKNDENSGQVSQAFLPSTNPDYENYQFLTQIDLTHSGLSPLFNSGDISSEGSNSAASSFQCSAPSTPFSSNNDAATTPNSLSESNKNFNNIWLQSTPNSDKSDKYSEEIVTWDQNLKQNSPELNMLPSPLLPKETKLDGDFEHVNNNSNSVKPSVFQTKYGLGNLSLYPLDEMEKKSKKVHYEDITANRNEKFTVITNFPFQKMNTDKQTKNEKHKCQPEQSPHLSSSMEMFPSNEKKLSQSSSLSKQNINPNLDMEISKTFCGKTVLRKPSETDSMSVNDITSTTSAQDFKIAGKDKKWLINHKECQVCGDRSAGFYCNAFICEACKVCTICLVKITSC